MTRSDRQRGNTCQLLIVTVVLVALACIGIASCVWFQGPAA